MILRKMLVFLVLLVLVPFVFGQEIDVEVKQLNGFESFLDSLGLLSIAADKPLAFPGDKVTLTVGIPLDLGSGQKVGNAEIIVWKGSKTLTTRNIKAEVQNAIGGASVSGPLGLNLQLKSTFNAPSSLGDYMVTYKVVDQNSRVIVSESQSFTVGSSEFACPKDSCGDWQTTGSPSLGTGVWQTRSCSSFEKSGTQCSQDARQEYQTVCSSPNQETISGKWSECDVPKPEPVPTTATPGVDPVAPGSEDDSGSVTTKDLAVVAGLTVAGAIAGSFVPGWGNLIGAVIGFVLGIAMVLII